MCAGTGTLVQYEEAVSDVARARRISVYEEAPGFRLGPRVSDVTGIVGLFPPRPGACPRRAAGSA
jgi:hypothetical protein